MAPAVAQTPAAAASQPLVRGLPDFTELVTQVGPAVVNIRTLERISGSSRRGGGSGGPQMDEEMQEFFRRFFGVPMPETPRGAPRSQGGEPEEEEREVPRGVGSGFIISADGYIMTNAHVVEGADSLLVTLPDKREFKARIIGSDRRSDVALVKVDATGLPTVHIGDVNKLRVGEWVVAIGSPFGLDSSVTAGIVSAKQRDTGDFLPLIQTDVAVNPGNSGGPLLNMRGEVVGINSQIYSRSGGYMGVSFAIPIDEAMQVSEQLRASGKVTRGRIGVRIDQVTKEVADSIGLGKARGAMVRSVESGSPAEKAGVEAGDIIIRFDGKPIEKMTDLPRLVGNTKPGTRSTLTVFRRGASRDLGIVIAEMASDDDESGSKKPAASEPKQPSKATPGAESLGLTLSELSSAQKKELKLKHGVRVDAATDAAARAGLRRGDVILSVGNAEVGSVSDFETALAKTERGKTVTLLVLRGDMVQYVLVRRAAAAR
ncbi:MAG: Do family serine endopeptidase [Burkholderiaceae bacterium]|nr:Do family serine endopeptidase [Burkholderiaceae bacterium]